MNQHLKVYALERTTMARLFRAVVFITCLGLTLSLAWAGTRMDGSGNTITRDVVAPAGGMTLNTLSNGSINATAGQVTAGLSINSQGMRIYHGIHGPVLLKTAGRDWKEYE
jgi:hypothetical protein